MGSIDPDSPALGRIVAVHPHPFALGIPPVLRASVKRHRANMALLLQSFRAEGMVTGPIEATVRGVIGSYKHELLVAIQCLWASDHSARDAR
jgi:hypothetical protein